jgi:hypothetical protein
MSFRSVTAAIAAASFLVCLSPARAQEAPPQMVRALSVTVKLGMENQFEEFVRKYKEAHDKVGTAGAWNTYTTVLGPENAYVFGSDFTSWKDLPTSAGPLVEAFGQAEADRLLALWASSAETSTSGTWVLRPDLSSDPTAAEAVEAKYFYFQTVRVRTFQNDAFEEWCRRVAEANRKLLPGNPYWGYAPMIGGDNLYVFVVPVADLAQIDGWTDTIEDRVEQVFGKAEHDRVVALAAAAVESVSDRIDVPRPELSRMPPAPTE